MVMTFSFIFASSANAFEPDHYVSYELKTASFSSYKIRLKDQFIDWTDFVVSKPHQLLNPALKRHDNKVHEINNPRLHYADYRLSFDKKINISADVIAVNQFGTFKLKNFRPYSLLVPSYKKALSLFEDGKIDVKGDHYLCYTIDPIKVEGESGFLKDQFRGRNFEKLVATRFCNPAAKIHNDKEYAIENDDEENHLMCFDIGSRQIVKIVQLLNQFGTKKALVVEDHEVCVPTVKIHLPTECKGSLPNEGGVCNGVCPNPNDTCEPTAAGPCACIPEEPTPCADTFPDPLGVCGGECPTGEVCIANGIEDCECQPEITVCGRDEEGTCGGTCPRSTDICVSDITTNECLCLPAVNACHDSLPDPQGVCGGICPSGEICAAIADDECACKPEIIRCGLQVDGTCGGECPVATDTCENDPFTNQCFCAPAITLCSDSSPDPQGVCGGVCEGGQICAVNADDKCECQLDTILCGRNEEGICGGECPTATDICMQSPFNDECLCVSILPQQCVDSLPDANGICGGICPAGQTCGVNADDRCECVDKITECGVQEDGQCGGLCPDPNSICKADATGNCFCTSSEPLFCADTTPDEEGICGGICPSGESCVINLDQGCECRPQSSTCERLQDGQCGGTCSSVVEICTNVPGTNDCGCIIAIDIPTL